MGKRLTARWRVSPGGRAARDVAEATHEEKSVQ
jgi:hypothetical protein